jgi:membrane protein YdbS with pleckstrin-like domain
MAFQRSIPVRLESDEKVILDIRRHGMVLFIRLLPPLMILIVPVVLILLALLMRGSDPGLADTIIGLARAALVLLLLPLAVWAGFAVYDWGNDSFHITSKRVVRYDQTYFTSQRMMAARLSQIQNVSVTVPDPIAQSFDYGTVVIETAAQAGKIEFDNIGHPRDVQRLIFELRGVPTPPEQPAPPPRGLRDLVLAMFPFVPITLPDGSILYHKHWFILVQVILLPVLLLFITLLTAVFIKSPLPLVLLVGILPLLLYQWANWENDIYILTDNRIIDIVRIPLVRENRREALLVQIQNVTVDIPNLQGRLLDMGDVFVETAGKAENFLFQTVEHPNAVAEEVNRRLDLVRSSRKQAEEESDRQHVEQMVSDIMQRQYGVAPPSGDTPPAPDF